MERLIPEVDDLFISFLLSLELRLPDPLLLDELLPDEVRDLFTLLPFPLLDLDRPTEVPELLLLEPDLLILLPDPLDLLDPLLDVPLDRPTFPELLPTEPDRPVLLTLEPLLMPRVLIEDPLVLGV